MVGLPSALGGFDGRERQGDAATEGVLHGKTLLRVLADQGREDGEGRSGGERGRELQGQLPKDVGAAADRLQGHVRVVPGLLLAPGDGFNLEDGAEGLGGSGLDDGGQVDFFCDVGHEVVLEPHESPVQYRRSGFSLTDLFTGP